MPAGKIGVYTRFFEYANFRLPLSTFLLNVLRHYRIHLSQLSVIAAAKVSHFEILCHVHNFKPTVGLFRCFYVNSKNKGWVSFSKRHDSDAVCYTKPLDSLKHRNDHFFWVDSFACPTSFPWHTSKNVSRDPFSKSTEFNADHYAVLVAHPAPFRKFPEPFLRLVGMSHYYTLDEDTYPSFLHDDGTDMDLFAFIQVADPTKVRVAERKRAEGEAKLMVSTVRLVIPLLPVAPARTESELEASVEKLFDEGGSTEQGDSAAGGDCDAEIELVTAVEDIAARNVTAERPKRPCKKRPAVTDTSGSSHPPKKLKGGHGTSSGVALGGKSPSVLKELLESSRLNVKVGVESVPTLPLVTSLVSATPEREVNYPIDSVTGANLRTIGPAERFVISSDSSHHSSTNAPEVEVDSIISSAGTVKPDVMGSSHLLGKELSMGYQEVDSENLYEVFILRWNMPNDALLDDLDTFKEFIDHLAPPVLIAQIRDMDYEQLFTEFSIGTTRQACLNAEVRMRTEYCLSERRILESECGKQADLLKYKDNEIERLKAQLLLKEAEAAEAAHLRLKNVALEGERDSLSGKIMELQSLVSTKDLELKDFDVIVSGYERLKERIEEFQDAQMNVVNEKVAKLDADLLEMALHLEEKFYPHLLTTISGRRWLLTHGLKLVMIKCIDHGREGRSLADIAAYNPAMEADYNSALHRLREMDFSPLTDAPGMSGLQPDIEQLRLPIHRSEDQVVLGETSLLFALNATHSRVERIRENVMAQRSALTDVWVPLVDPLSAENLMGAAGTSNIVPATAVTITALSTTFASASFIPPIIVDDYEVVGADAQENTQ
ncbi:hypothetical protein Tco_0918813 [Tanacetum coccineum]